MRDGVEDGRLGYRVEDDSLNFRLAERAALLEGLQNVPGDGLALAVGVGGEDKPVRALYGISDVFQALLSLRVDLPDHGEVGIGVDRAVFGRQIAHVPVTGEHAVIAAK